MNLAYHLKTLPKYILLKKATYIVRGAKLKSLKAFCFSDKRHLGIPLHWDCKEKKERKRKDTWSVFSRALFQFSWWQHYIKMTGKETQSVLYVWQNHTSKGSALLFYQILSHTHACLCRQKWEKRERLIIIKNQAFCSSFFSEAHHSYIRQHYTTTQDMMMMAIRKTTNASKKCTTSTANSSSCISNFILLSHVMLLYSSNSFENTKGREGSGTRWDSTHQLLTNLVVSRLPKYKRQSHHKSHCCHSQTTQNLFLPPPPSLPIVIPHHYWIQERILNSPLPPPPPTFLYSSYFFLNSLHFLRHPSASIHTINQPRTETQKGRHEALQ